VLRDLINAVGKATMYPPSHRFVVESAAQLVERLTPLVEERGALTLGVTPKGFLLDGVSVDPLPPILKEFAARLHRKNVGTIRVAEGVTATEVTAMLAALADHDAAEHVGREGWRSETIRIDPLLYEVLGFTDSPFDHELDEAFWGELVEAAFGRRLTDVEGEPTTAQVASAITERVERSPEEARRVFEALASFSSAIAARGERGPSGARKRFTEVLSALARPTQLHLVQAAPSPSARRRFLADTLRVVPPTLLLQLLESVAESDGEPISSQLRSMLGKLALGPDGSISATASFTAQVLGIVDQWEGGDDPEPGAADDARLVVEPARTLSLGLELASASRSVLVAARLMRDRGQFVEVLELVDAPGGDEPTVDSILGAVLEPGLLPRLLAAPAPDFMLIERVVQRTKEAAVPALLEGLERADNRTARRRLLDLLTQVGPGVEPVLMQRLDRAPWYLARNILVVLAQLPPVTNPEPILRALRHEEPRVRHEALKVLLRHPATRDRAISDVLEGGDEGQTRIALNSLGGHCPPSLVAPVLAVIGHPNAELQLQAVRLLADSSSPLVVPQLLTLVRTRGGFLRRLRLLPSTPLMLEALTVLATRWANHRPVIAILQMAGKSTDAQVRAAVGSTG
jgi:HEAT repeat protein